MGEPEIIRQGNRYGVRIKALSPSIHLIRAEIETEVSPIVGSETQAQELIEYMKKEEKQNSGIWNTLICVLTTVAVYNAFFITSVS